jgi:hypothetical protein
MKWEHPRFLPDPRLSPFQNFISESESAVITKNLFYPLEVAQTLLQTGGPDARDGILDTIGHLYKVYGFGSLYRGNIAENLAAIIMGVGSFVVKTMMHGVKFESNVAAYLANLIPHQILTVLVYPLHVAKVRMIANPSKYLDVAQSLRSINDEEGSAGMYKGLSFTLLETIPKTLTTWAGFELAKLAFSRPVEDLNVKENIALAVLGGFLAATLHYPFDTAKKIVMSRKAVSGENEGVVKTVADIGEKHGLVGLYKGFSANLLKLPAMFIERAIYQAAQVYFLKSGGFPAPHLHPAHPRI